ncbi:Intraflagellar transport protein 43 [Batrachochytrium dendrobatidis]|nr:Intraflagellar transport protein 43 [Batrachochytrium dendrobatidis]KAK5672109.1 Intraflagellar transport protein 43 [Batrachochytrium dendrobatidis]
MSLFKNEETDNHSVPSFLKSSSMDESLAEAINAIEPNTVPTAPKSSNNGSFTHPIAGRRAHAASSGNSRNVQAADEGDFGANHSMNRYSGYSLPIKTEPLKSSDYQRQSSNNLAKANMSSNENVSELLGRTDSLQEQLDQDDLASASPTRKSRFRASIDMIPKFSLSNMLKLDAGSTKKMSSTDVQSPTLPNFSGTQFEKSDTASNEINMTDGRETASRRDRRGSRSGVPVANNDIDDEKEKVRKTTVAGPMTAYAASSRKMDDGDQVMVIIPDLMDVEDEDMSATVAVAPTIKTKAMKTISEIESDISQSDAVVNQLQHLSVPGIDMSILIRAALCPPSQLDELDQPWDWDLLFTQVSSEIHAEKEKEHLKSSNFSSASQQQISRPLGTTTV